MTQERFKYQRTPHLPWSKGRSSDDIVLEALSHFGGRKIVCTEKRDGECTTLYADGYVHARSIDSASQPWQSWIRQFWRQHCYQLPEGWRICGENLYAEHSIPYGNLKGYFEAFSIWDEHNRCLSWPDTLSWLSAMQIPHVPVLYCDTFSAPDLKSLAESLDTQVCEGYVIRVADEFSYEDFPQCVAKFVRSNHVQTDQHWSRNWRPNQLAQ